jgi:hypothetical protein
MNRPYLKVPGSFGFGGGSAVPQSADGRRAFWLAVSQSAWDGFHRENRPLGGRFQPTTAVRLLEDGPKAGHPVPQSAGLALSKRVRLYLKVPGSGDLGSRLSVQVSA